MYNIEKNNSKKILIISPINRWGGVNVDVGFIAQAYNKMGLDVFVLSLGNYFNDCSIFNFVDRESFESIDRLILKRNFCLIWFMKALNFIKPNQAPIHHRLNNRLLKRFKLLSTTRWQCIQEQIDKHHIILMCHHFTGNYVYETAKYCQQTNKQFFLRVTQQINGQNFNFNNLSQLKAINKIIIHSSKNLPFLEENKFKNVCIIDQCVYLEHLYQPNFGQAVKSFYALGRIEKTKNLKQIIIAFKHVKLRDITLDIYGEGSEKEQLIELAQNDKRIKIHPSVNLDQIYQIHNQHSCLLISSHIEGGPYTALEAMCAGNLIISTRVGAMEDRLGVDYPYFYDGTTEALSSMINDVYQLDSNNVTQISKSFVSLYRERFSIKKISEAYQVLVE